MWLECALGAESRSEVSLQKRRWGGKQSGAPIELCSILDTLETCTRVWCWGDGSLGRVLAVQA